MRKAQIRPTDICFCGTGKQYRHCCQNLTKLPKNASRELKRRFWRKTVGDAVNLVSRFIEGIGGIEEFIDEALEDFSCDEHLELVIQLLRENGQLNDCFYIWMLFHFYADFDEITDQSSGSASAVEEGEEDEVLAIPLAVAAMTENNIRLGSDKEIAFSQLFKAPFSFYKVVSVQQGESIVLLDLFLDTEITVLDLAASRCVAPGLILYTQVLHFEDVSIMFGASEIPLPPISLDRILQLKECFQAPLKSPEKLSLEHILLAEDHIRRFYLLMITPIVNPRPPTLTNTDGDPMEPRTLSYSHSFSNFMEVVTKLDKILSDSEEYPPYEVINKDGAGNPLEVMVPWVVAGKKNSTFETILIARFVVKDKRIEVSVNSKKRAARAKKFLKQHFAGTAKYLKEIEDSIDIGKTGPSSSGLIDQKELSPEMLTAVAEMMKKQENAWMDIPVPALRGMTPRVASKDPLGKELLEALLNDYDLRSTDIAESGFMGFDIPELRARLGLTDLN